MEVTVVALLLHIREVLGSKLSRDANYRRVSAGKPDIIFKMVHDSIA